MFVVTGGDNLEFTASQYLEALALYTSGSDNEALDHVLEYIEI